MNTLHIRELTSLNKPELELGLYAAIRRKGESIKANLKDKERCVATSLLNMDADLLGAFGEIAVAKRTGRYWMGLWNTFGKGADVWPNIQVRTIDNYHKNLIVRPEDSDLDIFVSVVAVEPTVFDVVGWIQGKHAKRDEYWAPKGGDWAWWFPLDSLHKIEALEMPC